MWSASIKNSFFFHALKFFFDIQMIFLFYFIHRKHRNLMEIHIDTHLFFIFLNTLNFSFDWPKQKVLYFFYIHSKLNIHFVMNRIYYTIFYLLLSKWFTQVIIHDTILCKLMIISLIKNYFFRLFTIFYFFL